MRLVNGIFDILVFVFHRIPNYMSKKVDEATPPLWFVFGTLMAISIYGYGNLYPIFAIKFPATYYPAANTGTFFTMFISFGISCVGLYSLLKDIFGRENWLNPFKGAQYNEDLLEDWVCFFFYPCAVMFGSISFISQLVMPPLVYLILLLSIIGVLTLYVLMGVVSVWRHLT